MKVAQLKDKLIVVFYMHWQEVMPILATPVIVWGKSHTVLFLEPLMLEIRVKVLYLTFPGCGFLLLVCYSLTLIC